LERCAATGPAGEPLALDRFHAEHLADDRLDPDLCVLARRGERLVGAAICETWDDVDGTIVQLAVDPTERFLEIGGALLLTAFARMRERGLEIAVVQVGGPGPDAPELYTSVGLRPAWQATTWRKPLG
jgi:ribosomal protein S18 acetylase RimI-like enzyme